MPAFGIWLFYPVAWLSYVGLGYASSVYGLYKFRAQAADVGTVLVRNIPDKRGDKQMIGSDCGEVCVAVLKNDLTKQLAYNTPHRGNSTIQVYRLASGLECNEAISRKDGLEAIETKIREQLKANQEHYHLANKTRFFAEHYQDWVRWKTRHLEPTCIRSDLNRARRETLGRYGHPNQCIIWHTVDTITADIYIYRSHRSRGWFSYGDNPIVASHVRSGKSKVITGWHIRKDLTDPDNPSNLLTILSDLTGKRVQPLTLPKN